MKYTIDDFVKMITNSKNEIEARDIVAKIIIETQADPGLAEEGMKYVNDLFAWSTMNDKLDNHSELN